MEPGRRKKAQNVACLPRPTMRNGERLHTIRCAGHDRLPDAPQFQHITAIGSQPSVNGLEEAEVNGSIRLKRPVGFPETSSPAAPVLL
jgi:hypothetical protein